MGSRVPFKRILCTVVRQNEYRRALSSTLSHLTKDVVSGFGCQKEKTGELTPDTKNMQKMVQKSGLSWIADPQSTKVTL